MLAWKIGIGFFGTEPCTLKIMAEVNKNVKYPGKNKLTQTRERERRREERN